MPWTKIVDFEDFIDPLPSSHQEAAETQLGHIEWQTPIRGFCKCPGEQFHTHKTGKKDCEVRIDGAPTITCFHASCYDEVYQANQELRSTCGKIDKAAGLPMPDLPRKTNPAPTKGDRLEEATEGIKSRIKEITAASLCETQETIPESATEQFKRHLAIFDPSDYVWHGETYATNSFKTAADWQTKGEPVGNYIGHSTFLPCSKARSNSNIEQVKFLVVESDELNHREQKGIFATMRDKWGWDLRLVIDTAGKSLHAWFAYPHRLKREEIKAVLEAVGCDTKLLTDSQPSRVAGAMRDGQMQSIIWIGSGSPVSPISFEEICSGKIIMAKWGQNSRPGNDDEAISRRPEVILDGLLYARSKLIVGGVAKAGKSYFSMKLANALATGSKFLQWTATKPRKVLYIDFELHEWELDERCSRVCNWKVPDNMGTISLRKHHLVRDTASLGRVIAQEGMGADVIILDCLYKFNDAEDENDNAAMKAIGAWMDGIISLTGAAVILIHHFGKGGGQGRDAIDRFRGASSIVGEMDAILGLAKHEDDGHFIIETTARSFKPTSPFVAHWDFPHWVMTENKDASKAAKPGVVRSISDDDLLKLMPVGPENAKKHKEFDQPLEAKQFRERVAKIDKIRTVELDAEPGQRGRKPVGYYRWQ